MIKSIKQAWLLVPFLAGWLGLFAAPLLLVIRVSFYEGGGSSGFGIGSQGGYYTPGTWTLQPLQYVFTDETILQTLSFNIVYGITVALISMIIGLILSVGLSELAGKTRRIGLFLVILTKFANLLVIIYGLKWILSNAGPINNLLLQIQVIDEPVELLNGFFAATVGKTYLIIPYVTLILTVRFSKIDPCLIQSARILGLGPLQTYIKVILPLSSDAIQTSIFISLVWGIGAYVSPLFLGSPDQWTLSIEVQRQVFENINFPRGAAVAVQLLLVFMTLSSLFYCFLKKVGVWQSL